MDEFFYRHPDSHRYIDAKNSGMKAYKWLETKYNVRTIGKYPDLIRNKKK